jgi:PE family
MVMNVNATAVGTSAATETGISAEMGAATAAASAALVGVMPMGADLDSAEFAAALNAAGASYIGTATEHLANRGMFAGAQDLAAATYTATDVINNAALGLA